MENPNQRPSTTGTFLRGFTNSAGSGALMSGIFYGLAIAAFKLFAFNPLHFAAGTTVIGAAASVLPVALFMVAAIGLFGGVMAMKRAGEEQREAAQTGIAPASRARSQEVTIVPAMAPMVAADRAEAPGWAARMGGPADNRIQQILANGSMSDRDRASAILAEREAAVNAQQQR